MLDISSMDTFDCVPVILRDGAKTMMVFLLPKRFMSCVQKMRAGASDAGDACG